jgi:hypothetical protein
VDVKTHWEKVYTTKGPEAFSWYRAHLETSFALIQWAAHSRSASFIDIGAGESTLVDDLIARGYENITFGPEGPTKCSGLDVIRYDAESLHEQFGARFRLVESTKELHRTPFGTTQQFLYCYCKVE